LLNLNALPSLKVDVLVVNISKWRVECLMTAPFAVIDVFPNDFPVFEVEHSFAENFVGVEESVEDKPTKLLATKF
jgi:hypothetical protein